MCTLKRIPFLKLFTLALVYSSPYIVTFRIRLKVHRFPVLSASK